MPQHPRRSVAAVVAAVLVAGLGVSGSAAPAVAGPATDSWQVPSDAEITIRGKGYGHGTGLSQYGAQRAAALGEGYRQIVRYYYPGTRWGTTGGKVRVWISRDLTNDVQVAARDGLRARKVGAERSWRLDRARPRATRWRIVPAGDRASVLEYRDREPGWHRFRTVRGTLELTAGRRPVRLFQDGGSVAYRGLLRSVPSSPGNRITVNIVPMETYLRGVVPAETYASAWHQQALRAQAVAARTYAAHERADRRGSVYDLCETAACQAYGGASAEYPSTDRAVRATARRILTWRGRPAFTQFTASSGGWTVAGPFPYLPAMRDKWQSRRDPNHSWEVDFTDDELEAAWPALGDLTAVRITGRDGNGEWGGRAGRVVLTGEDGAVEVSGSDFAAALGLRSPWLTLRVR